MLGELFHRMSGAAVAQAIGTRHDAARESYRIRAVIDGAPIETLGGLRALVVDFHRHQHRHAVFQDAGAPEEPEQLVWDAMRELLEAKYRGGLRGALRAASSGVDGGVRGIIGHVYSHLKDEHIKAYRRLVLARAVSPVDWDARVALAGEFLHSTSCIVPKERQLPAEELAARIEETVEKHVELVGYSRKASGR